MDDIQVKDENNKEVSLLDLSMYGGLCERGPGVTFIMGKNLKEAEKYIKYVYFDESVASYLEKSEHYYHSRFFNDGPIKEFDWLIELNPYSGKDAYGEQRLSTQEVHNLINLCDALIKKYHTYHIDDQKLRYFARKLKDLCKETLENNQVIFIDGY